MSTPTLQSGIPPEIMAEMQAVADAAAAGKPVDPEVARRVREKADKIRQRLLETHGLQEIGVPILREIRGDLPES